MGQGIPVSSTADPAVASLVLLFAGNGKGESTAPIDFAYGLLNAEALGELAAPGGPVSASEALKLIPAAHRWVDPETQQRCAPLPLCEFLAYKAALAYRGEDAIAAAFSPAEHCAFFNSRQDKGVDTQGYGFFHQGHAFIILRGTESRGDWQINLADSFTHSLAAEAVGAATAAVDDAVLRKLKNLYAGDLLPLIGKLTPGRHLGFTIGWGAVRESIETWLAKFPEDTPLVFSGHSLGGALALLGAHDFASRPKPREIAAVVTFGAPQVGNSDFADEYNALSLNASGFRLGDRTIRIEAEGDIVPRIMRRWYYRLPSQTKQWVQRQLQSGSAVKASSEYQIVGREWVFDKQPPLSEGEFRSAVWTVKQAAIRQAKEEAEQAKDSAPSKPQPAAETAPASDNAQAAPGQTPQDSGKGSMIVIYVVLSIFALIGVWLTWLFIRSKLASHAIDQRYALYLSTLSYRRIRALHGGDLERANADLGRYLAFVRGDRGVKDDAFFKSLRDLPLRLNADHDVQTFESNGSYIC